MNASYTERYQKNNEVSEKEQTRPIFVTTPLPPNPSPQKREKLTKEDIEKEFSEMKRFNSPVPASRVGGWFTCQTCTTI